MSTLTNLYGRHPLYQAAIDADEAFDAVIAEVHGKKASRWGVPLPLDARIEKAYGIKKAADFNWIEYMHAARKVQS